MQKNETQESTRGLTNSTEAARTTPTPRPNFGLPEFGIAPLGQHSNSSRPPPLQASGIAPLGGVSNGIAPLGSLGLQSFGVAPLEMHHRPAAPVSEAPIPAARATAKPSLPPIAKSTNALASLVDRLVPASAPKAETAVQSEAPVSIAPPTIKPVVTSAPNLDDEDDWDIGETTAQTSAEPRIAERVFLNGNDVEPVAAPSVPPLAKTESDDHDDHVVLPPPRALDSVPPAASEVPAVSGIQLTATESSLAESSLAESSLAESSLAESEDDDDAALMALIAAAKAKADDIPPPPPRALDAAPSTASEVPAASKVELTIASPTVTMPEALPAGEPEDDDAELMALIAAAKAKADDVPPPPPRAPELDSVASAAQSASNVETSPEDDDAELMALIAAAKAKADDVPPPPPRAVDSAPPAGSAPTVAPLSHVASAATIAAPNTESNGAVESSGSEDDDDDAELMALIAAAKAKADDVPPPPPRAPDSMPPAGSVPTVAPVSHVAPAIAEAEGVDPLSRMGS